MEVNLAIVRARRASDPGSERGRREPTSEGLNSNSCVTAAPTKLFSGRSGRCVVAFTPCPHHKKVVCAGVAVRRHYRRFSIGRSSSCANQQKQNQKIKAKLRKDLTEKVGTPAKAVAPKG